MEKNVQHIDLDEIKKAREALNRELGIEPEKKVVTKPRVKELKLADDIGSKTSNESKKIENDDESNKDFSVYDNFAPFEVNKPIVSEEKKTIESKPQEVESTVLEEAKEEKENAKTDVKTEENKEKPKSLDEFLAGFNSLDDLMNMDLDSFDLGEDSSNTSDEQKTEEEKSPVQDNSPSLEEKVDKLKENYDKESNSMAQKKLDENLSKNLLDEKTVEEQKKEKLVQPQNEVTNHTDKVENNNFVLEKKQSPIAENKTSETLKNNLHKNVESVNKASQNQSFDENRFEGRTQNASKPEPQKIEKMTPIRENIEQKHTETQKKPAQNSNNFAQKGVENTQKSVEKSTVNESKPIKYVENSEPKPIKKVESDEPKPFSTERKDNGGQTNSNISKSSQNEPQKFGQEQTKQASIPTQSQTQNTASAIVSNNKADVNPLVNNQMTQAKVDVSPESEDQKKEKDLLPSIEDFKFIDIIKSNSFMESDELTCIYGMDEKKNVICQNFKDFYNVGIFTENDDEVFKLFSSVILSLTLKNSSYAIKYAICDAKNGSKFDAYNDLSHLFFNRIAKTNGEIIDTLTEISNEIEKRYEYLAKIGAKNIESFNEVMKKENIAPMPYIILFFNNYTRAVLLDDSDKINTNLFNILKFGRLVGIYVNLVVFDEKLDDKINFNLQTRISFKAEDKTSSVNRIGKSGAEKIENNDEYVLKTLSNEGFIHLKVPNISQKEVELLIKNIEK